MSDKKRKRVAENNGGVTGAKIFKPASKSEPDFIPISSTKSHKVKKAPKQKNNRNKPSKTTASKNEKKKPEKILHAHAKRLKVATKETPKNDEGDNETGFESGKGKVKSTASKKKRLEEVKKADGKISKKDIDEMHKKDRKKLRKMQNVNFDVSAKAKLLWEEYRRHKLTPERKQACSEELCKLIKGNVHGLVFAHDTSRVIQSMMKYGTVEQKAAIFDELKDHLVKVMKSKYAKFYVTKLLKYGTKEQKDHIFVSMYGKLRKLIRHREAAAIVESAYNNHACAAMRSAMAADFYGKTFAVFKTPEDKTLQAFVKAHPEKSEDVVNFLKRQLTPLVDKEIVQHSFVHRLFLDFFTVANEAQRTEMIETVREHTVHMLHTHDGARIAMICLWHGTAKDRKVIIKSFKTYVMKISQEEFGHMVLLALFDVVDDTKIVQKAILDELLQSVDEVANDKYGRKVLLYLLLPRDPLHFHPDIVSVLQQGDSNQHSKKDRTVRHNELLSHVSPKLLNFLTWNCRQLFSDVDKHLLVLSVIKHCLGDPTAAMQAVAQVVAEPFAPSNRDSPHHIVDDPSGHFIVKWLILNDRERIKMNQQVLFSSVLLDTVPVDRLQSWITCNRSCFILVSLLEVESPSITNTVVQRLSPVKGQLQQQQSKGAQILLQKLSS